MTKPKKQRIPISVNWSTDILAIPKGKWVNATQINNKKEVTVRRWQSDELWLYAVINLHGSPQAVVTKSYWIPKDDETGKKGRWCGSTAEAPPRISAWAPYHDLNEEQAPPLPPDLQKDVA